MKRFLFVPACSLILAGNSVAQTYSATDAAEFVQSIAFVQSEFVVSPADFGYIDITFANGTEIFGVPLETDFLLADEPLPPILPACGCDGWDGLVVEADQTFVAYYLTTTNQFGQVFDGLLLRIQNGGLCVNAIRKTIQPFPVISVDGVHDCMALEAVVNPGTDLRRLARLIESLETRGDRPTIDWPQPLCLTCPPWTGYMRERQEFDKRHRENIMKESERVLNLIQDLRSR